MSHLSQQIGNTSAAKLALTVQRMRSKAGGIDLLNAEPIAIIGMGCRFPGGVHDPESYWQLLRNGVDAITQVPPDRWDVEAFFDPDPDAPGKMCTRWGGFLKDIDQFDCQFFGISPREAASMDPQQRLLLEVSWEALEAAGQAPDKLVGSQTGVFVGISLSEYAHLFGGAGSADVIYAGTGNASSVASGRISYALGLQGPNLSLDTACSSSLVAVHLACQSLRAEDCRMALAGGVNLILTPTGAIYFSKLRAMAPDGRCKTFDAGADGYVRSEGCGVVVLKRLSDALADGDRIEGLIRGSAVNHDGRSSGLTVPNGPSQQAVLRSALAHAGLEPSQVSYVECHGTGTPLGDPIETGALAAVFGGGRTDPLWIGSVKTNIGHTESAAGIAGLMKTVFAFQHGEIPPHLHFKTANPHLALDQIPAVIPVALTPWPAPFPGSVARRIAGVSAFALSGTNAHVVLETAPAQEDQPASDEPCAHLLPFSARSPEALEALAHKYEAFLNDSTIPLTDICYTAAVRRSHHDFRMTVAGTSRAELAGNIAAAMRPSERAAPGRKLVFVFPGQGSQWLGMGRELLAKEPVFSAALERCQAALRPFVDWSLQDVLTGNDPELLDRTDVIQPTLFAIQVALAALWDSWGVRPHAVVGHSMGEVAAAFVAGALSLEDAARIIAIRSRLLTRIAGHGAMAAVELSFEQAKLALADYQERISIAAINSARFTILSGDPAALEELLESLERREVFTRRVKVNVASHSPHVDALGPDLLSALRPLQPRPSVLRFHSTVTGEAADGMVLDAAYWVRNLRQPVRFATAVERLRAEGYDLFLEISPHPILLPAIKESLGVRALPSLRREEPERGAMLESLGALYTLGLPVEWSAIYPAGRPVPLPLYPWQRERHWLEASPNQPARPAEASHLQSSIAPEMHFWERELSLQLLPWLRDHRVQDAIVMPAAGTIEMVLTAAGEAFGPGSHVLEDLAFERPLVIPEEGAQTVQVVFSEEEFQVSARQGQQWESHARGKLRLHQPASTECVSLEAIRVRCPEEIAGDEYYNALEAVGLRYGRSFRGVQRIWRRDGEALGRLRLPRTSGPGLLDSCFQLLAATLSRTDASLDLYIPAALQSCGATPRPFEGEIWGHAVLRDAGSQPGRAFECDLSLLDDAGNVLLAAPGLRVERLSREKKDDPGDWLYEIQWQPQELVARIDPAHLSGPWLILGDGGGLAEALKAVLELTGEQCVAAAGEPYQRLLRDTAPRGVVYFAHPDTPPMDSCTGVLHLVQAVARMEWRDAPRLWLVTCGAMAPDAAGLAQAPLWGLGRVIALEHPELQCTRLDLGAGTDLDGLVKELLARNPEDQIAWRDGVRHVARLARFPLQPKPATLPASPGQAFRLEITTPGILDQLALSAASREVPGSEQVEIEVHAAGLNFNDVMKAMGVYPGLPDGPVPLGNECSGRVARVGPGVEGWSVGDEVVAVAPYSFGSFVTTPAPLVAHKPARLSFAEGAAIPLAFMTAVYALRHLARLAPGERVLIHAASGGVGLAAVQIAQQAGAEVFATAGSPEKRAYLKSLGVEHVLDSRTLDFAEEVMTRTRGRGVDVVLNSLAGDAMIKSLALVAPFGRFLEIGKRDIYEDRRVGLAPFQKHLAYFSIDLARLFAERPGVCADLFHEVMEGFAAGTFQSLRCEVFPINAAADAFRRMAQARHIGKIVISLQSAEPVMVEFQNEVSFHPDRTYLITGGLGGLGLVTARWMVEQGARHLALIGRREPSTEAHAAVAELQAHGATVAVVQADVSQPEHVARALAEIDDSMPPLAGIFHAAGLLDDGVLQHQTEERFHKVMAPKVAGAWNLHTMTMGRPLDFFVLFSSAASLIGSPGQGNYAAANAYLDGLAHYRHAQGLPALSINWGAWSEVGLAAFADPGGRMARLGMLSITPQQGVETLSQLLRQDAPQIGAMRLDMRRWLHLFPQAAAAPFFALLTLEEPGVGGVRARESRIRKELLALEPGPQRRMLLESHLLEQLAQVLRLSASQIDRSQPLQSFGLDSLMALELRNRLEASLGLSLSATLVWGYPTITALAGHLAAKMEIPLDAPAVAHTAPSLQNAARAAVVEELKLISEEEAEALLLQELTNIDAKRSR